MNTKYIKVLCVCLAGLTCTGVFSSCNDYLDEEPQSSISPDLYLTEESQLASYANGLYTDVLPGHAYGYGIFGEDNDTDNQASFTANNRYLPGQWRTTQSQCMENDAYRFKFIYSCNYFLENVLPRYNAGEISGDDTLTVSVEVRNTGKVTGKEVVQLYISDLKSGLPRPEKELKGFRKVELAPGEARTVTFTISKDDLSFFDAEKHGWVAEPGRFKALIGSASDDIRTEVAFEME